MTTIATHAGRLHDRGMATAEYAVGMAGAACIGCIVLKLGADGWNGWITEIFDRLREVGAWLNIWSTPWRGL